MKTEPCRFEPVTKPVQTKGRAESISAAAESSGRKLRRAVVVAAVLVVVGLVAGLVPRLLHARALVRETRELAVVRVSVVSPAPGKAAPGLTLPAEVKAYLESPIYARASGYLKRYLVDIGEQLKEGDLLAEIDTPELDQELAQARAVLTQTQAALSIAKQTSERWTELLKSNSVSQQETAEKQADFALKTANVEAAQSNVRRLEELQGFKKVIAPFSGTVTVRNTDVGQLISGTGGKELFRLAQTAKLRVYARVPQSASRGIGPGQKAELTFPEVPGRVFPATIVRTSGAMSADSRTLLTELEVDNSRGEILAGSYAQVRFTENRTESALTLPSNTLLFRPEGPQVGIVQPDGKVELRTVNLGRDFGPTVEILDGVTVGDRVILNPADSLVSGTIVRLVEPGQKQIQEREKGSVAAK